MRHFFGGESRIARSTSDSGNGPANPSRRAAIGALAGATVAGPQILAQAAVPVLAEAAASTALAGKVAAMLGSVVQRQSYGIDISDILERFVRIEDDEGGFSLADVNKALSAPVIGADGKIKVSTLSKLQSLGNLGADVPGLDTVSLEDLCNSELMTMVYKAAGYNPPTPKMLAALKDTFSSIQGVTGKTTLKGLEDIIKVHQKRFIDTVLSSPKSAWPEDSYARKMIARNLSEMSTDALPPDVRKQIEILSDDHDAYGTKSVFQEKTPEQVAEETRQIEKAECEYKNYIFTSVHSRQQSTDSSDGQFIQRFHIQYSNFREKEKAMTGLTKQNFTWLRDKLNGSAVSGALIEVEDVEDGVILKTTDTSLIRRLRWLEENRRPLKVPRFKDIAEA
jgi:hypothetical protein